MVAMGARRVAVGAYAHAPRPDVLDAGEHGSLELLRTAVRGRVGSGPSLDVAPRDVLRAETLRRQVKPVRDGAVRRFSRDARVDRKLERRRAEACRVALR